MAISAYVGLMGHGKSYGVVENVIIPALKSGRKIFSNIPMNDELCLEKFENQVISFDTKDVNDTWFQEVFADGALIVIDECWRLWPSGMMVNKAPEGHKTFLMEHRHLVGEDGKSTEIVLVTQNLGQLASFVRSIIETTFWVNKLSKAGLKNRYRVDVFSGAVKEITPHTLKKNREREIHGKFKKEVFALYQSHTHSKHGAGDETRVDDRFNVFSGSAVWWFFGIILTASIASWFLAIPVLEKMGLISADSSDSAKIHVSAHQNSLNPSQIKPQELQKAKKPDPRTPFLSEVEKIAVVGRIQSDSLNQFSDAILFEVYASDSVLMISEKLLRKLGYKIFAHSECLIEITGHDFDGFVFCPSQQRDKKSVFSNVEF
jgi:zona occludens toxin